MIAKPAGKSVELPYQANTRYLEHPQCETVRVIYQSLHTSGLDKFTYLLIDSLWNDLSVALYHLERLPEAAFKELMEVIEGLSDARNELRHARFLFDVEEINSVHRLVMRNRAVVMGEKLLHKVLLVWPQVHSSS